MAQLPHHGLCVLAICFELQVFNFFFFFVFSSSFIQTIWFRLITLAIASVLQAGTRLFFPQNNFIHKMVKIRNEKFGFSYEFLCLSGTHSLEVTNTPWTEKVLGSNPGKTYFFLRFSISKSLSAYRLSDYCKTMRFEGLAYN